MATAMTQHDTDRAAEATAALDAARTIDLLRGEIDALDESIIRLVAERTAVSARVQAARINAGGTRLELGRERVVVDRYRTGLGNHGASLAEAILRVGRGER